MPKVEISTPPGVPASTRPPESLRGRRRFAGEAYPHIVQDDARLRQFRPRPCGPQQHLPARHVGLRISDVQGSISSIAECKSLRIYSDDPDSRPRRPWGCDTYPGSLRFAPHIAVASLLRRVS